MSIKILEQITEQETFDIMINHDAHKLTNVINCLADHINSLEFRLNIVTTIMIISTLIGVAFAASCLIHLIK